ncbi:MAG: N-acetyl-gamma-glutamyl-phosphate reductase [bacterium]
MKKIAVVGATGYTGVELLRLLSVHPHIELAMVTSRSHAGTRVDAMFPNLRHYVDLEFTAPDDDALAACDVVFFATPNGIAMKSAASLLAKGTRIIDLAADFRIKDIAVWTSYYGMEHACPELVAEAVYGLPEINREAIRSARLVANPGCYPTAVILGLLPLLEAGLIATDDIIADTKSGVTGAGRQAKVQSLMSEVNDSFKAYAVQGHRHQPEIAGILSAQIQQPVPLLFQPHLLPMNRGIHATLYAKLLDNNKHSQDELADVYQQRYTDEPFVDVMPVGSCPETRSVRGSNVCRISPNLAPQGGRTVVLSVIDNLVKGAAGQAVQNMNLMLGFAETDALMMPALMP